MEKEVPDISVILTNALMKRKNIHVLKNDTGSIISDQKDILKEIHSFYKTLYTSKSTPNNKDNINSFLDKLDIPQFLDDSETKLNRPTY